MAYVICKNKESLHKLLHNKGGLIRPGKYTFKALQDLSHTVPQLLFFLKTDMKACLSQTPSFLAPQLCRVKTNIFCLG